MSKERRIIKVPIPKAINNRNMKETLKDLIIIMTIVFLVSMLLALLSIGKQEQIEKEIEYNKVHYSPMKIHQKY
tara:strand:+ start:1388 stop:1609 length:222 start_codon:yes stop_codon:yes gene_type:complete